MIQTESTPNPNSLKFLSEKTISEIGNEEFQKNKVKDLSNPFIKELLDFKESNSYCYQKIFCLLKRPKIYLGMS